MNGLLDGVLLVPLVVVVTGLVFSTSVPTRVAECNCRTVTDLLLDGAEWGHPCRRLLNLSVSSLVIRVGDTVLLCLMNTARGVR